MVMVVFGPSASLEKAYKHKLWVGCRWDVPGLSQGQIGFVGGARFEVDGQEKDMYVFQSYVPFLLSILWKW